MADKNNPNCVTLDDAKGRGYILIPYNSTLSASLGSSFSSEAASVAPRNPFDVPQSPFDVDSLQDSPIIYHGNDSCKGTYSSAEASQSSFRSDHMSLDFGIGIGNDFLGAGVSGQYDKSILQDAVSSKTSRRTTFQAGALHFLQPPALSDRAKNALQDASAGSGGGYPGFCAQFGDFYVSGLIIGGSAAVCVMQASIKDASAERIKIQAEAHALMFSTTETIMDEDVSKSAQLEQYGVSGFDSLTQHFAEIPLQTTSGLQFDDARRLARTFDGFVNRMPDRVGEYLERSPDLLVHGARLTHKNANHVLRSGIVTHLVLSPLSTHREVGQYVVTD